MVPYFLRPQWHLAFDRLYRLPTLRDIQKDGESLEMNSPLTTVTSMFAKCVIDVEFF